MIHYNERDAEGTHTLIALGAKTPEVVLYTSSLPLVPYLDQTLSVPMMIAQTGNHWRKIFTLYAKLLVPDIDDWRIYRDNRLLHSDAQIRLPDETITSRIRIVSGKANWAVLGYDENQATTLDEQGRLQYQGATLFAPYFDYRQFPNELVTVARVWLSRFS